MNKLEISVDKIYKNLWYTHKVHEKQCIILSIGSLAIRLLSVAIIVTVLLLQFIQALDNTNNSLTFPSIMLTVLEVGLSFFILNFNYDKLLEQHRSSAKQLVRIKNKMIVAQSKGITAKELNEIANELSSIYFNAPQTGIIASVLANIEWNKEYNKK